MRQSSQAVRSVALLAGLLTATVLVVAAPTPRLGAPKTLSHVRKLGNVSGRAAPVSPPFPVGYLGLSWKAGEEPSVRFRQEGRWSGWDTAHHDELPRTDGRTFSALISGGGAAAYQVRGRNRDLHAVAINTTDGPRELTVGWDVADASHISQPGIITRSQWGADESFRFDGDGSEVDPQEFHPTTKIILHHTAGENADPDPAATIRAIYRYHAVDRGWGDIGYNFLIDARGRIYKGRYSGPLGTRNQDTLTGEDGGGNGVRSHQAGGHPGTVGVSVLGTYSTARVPTAARAALVDHVAWEAERHGLDPLGSTVYSDPNDRKFSITVPNISGHRDWARTECPGGRFYSYLPAIREEVAAAIAEPAPQTASYSPAAVTVSRGNLSGNGVSALSSDDAAYFRVNSVKPATTHIVDWSGRMAVGGSPLRKIRLTYDGSASDDVKQILYIRRPSNRTWERLHAWTVSTADQTFRWSTTRPWLYVSSRGVVSMRVRATSSRSSFVLQGDLARLDVEY
ncbi:MAG: peptidoglycan recognition protein family protein [Actinomycetota bacterium]|nr:peptidoglycan recognition protein family protein [Actinomycetota bacterium]